MLKDIFFRRLFVLSSLVLLIFVLWKLKIVILYLLAASLLSVVLSPLKKYVQKIIFLKNEKISNIISTIITLFIFFFIFFIFFTNITPSLIHHLQKISYEDLKSIVHVSNEYIFHKLEEYKLYNDSVKKTMDISKILTTLVPSVFDFVIGSLPKIFSGIIIIIFISFFMMKSPDMFKTIIVSTTKDEISTKILSSLASVRKIIRKYIYGVAIQLSILILLYTISMSILGMKGAFVISFFVAMFNVIPYIGPIIGGVITLLFCISTNLHLEYDLLFSMVTKVVIVYAILQLLDGMVSQPVIFSKVVRAHPLEIFIVIISSGFLFGVAGMMFAVPSYAILRIIAREFLYKFKVIQFITKNIKH